MRLLFFVLAALALVVVLGLIALEDPGYVLISRAPYEIEISLALLALLLVVGFALLYLLFRFLSRLAGAPRDMRKWRARKRVDQAQNATLLGYAGLITGDWERAEKKLAGSLAHTPTPMLNYLGAAYAAQQRGDTERRDAYLRDAGQQDPGNRFAVGLTKARLQYQTGQISEAGATLEKLRSYAPGNPAVLRLLADVHREAGDWPQVAGLIPALTKAKAYPISELRVRELEAYREIFDSPVVPAGEAHRLLGAWQSLPRAKKRDPDIVALYTRQLIENASYNQAEKLLRAAIKREWNSELVYLYGLVDSSYIDEQYRQAQNWAQQHGSDPDLLLTLGRLAMRKELWEQARDYLRQAIDAGARKEAYTELGLLLEQLGDRDQALECYRQGIRALAPPPIPALANGASQQLVLAAEAAPAGNRPVADTPVAIAPVEDASIRNATIEKATVASASVASASVASASVEDLPGEVQDATLIESAANSKES